MPLAAENASQRRLIRMASKGDRLRGLRMSVTLTSVGDTLDELERFLDRCGFHSCRRTATSTLLVENSSGRAEDPDERCAGATRIASLPGCLGSTPPERRGRASEAASRARRRRKRRTKHSGAVGDGPKRTPSKNQLGGLGVGVSRLSRLRRADGGAGLPRIGPIPLRSPKGQCPAAGRGPLDSEELGRRRRLFRRSRERKDGVAITVDHYGHLNLSDIARDLALVEATGINPLQGEE